MEEKFFGKSYRASRTFRWFGNLSRWCNIAKSDAEDFTVDERNLLSVGFKNQIGSQHGAIRTIGAIE